MSVPPPWAKVHCHIPLQPYGLGWYSLCSPKARIIMATWHFNEPSSIEWALREGLILC